MKRLYILCFSTLCLVLNFFARNSIGEPFLFYNSILHEITERDSIKVLIIGDSHISYAVKNEFLTETALSVAFPGQSPIAGRILYEYAKSKHPEIRTVIVEAGDHYYDIRRNNLLCLRGLPPCIFMNTDLGAHIKAINLVDYFLPVRGPYLKRFLFDELPRASIDFHQGNSLSTEISNERINTLYSSFDPRLISEIEKYSEVVFISPPLPCEVRELNVKKILNYYPNSVNLEIEMDYPDDYFYDTDHINEKYSEEFTLKLNSIIVSWQN